jgi:CheY-like chemotaxis protein
MYYKTVLHTDDDQELFQESIGGISTEITCISISKATEAITKLSMLEIMVDLIFLDYNMPLMNGEEFLIYIIKKSEVLKNIPVIMLSTT